MINCVKMVMVGMLQMFAMTNSQTLIGSTQDDHGCVTDGGYQWCESLNECVRPWTTPCPMDQPMNQPIVDPGFSVPVNPPVAIDPLPISPPESHPPAPPAPMIPHGCATWFDGCNHCMVSDGQLTACTRMMCFTQRPAECLSYNRLNEGDICYRFCENGSEQTIDSRSRCPSGSTCAAPNTIGFDSCGTNAWTCQAQH